MYENECIDLTYGEKKALAIVENAIDAAGLDYSKVHIERRTSQYLSIFIRNTDFLRIKIGKFATWFSVDAWRGGENVTSDPRFDEMSNRNIRHWKIELNGIDDLKNNTDIIVNVFRSTVTLEEA